jgi:hypothetical protein
MSYWVYLEISTGEGEPVDVFEWNYTSNGARMWREAGVDLRDLNGKNALHAMGPLAQAIGLMIEQPERFRALEPDNGWGSYDSLVPALQELLQAMARHHKTTVRVSH